MYHIIILCLRNYNTNFILYMTRFKMVMIDNYIEILYHIYCTILASGYIDTLDWAGWFHTNRQTDRQNTIN